MCSGVLSLPSYFKNIEGVKEISWIMNLGMMIDEYREYSLRLEIVKILMIRIGV